MSYVIGVENVMLLGMFETGDVQLFMYIFIILHSLNTCMTCVHELNITINYMMIIQNK